MNELRIRLCFWISLLVINSGCGQIGASPETEVVEVARKQFQIPSRYVMPALPASLVPSIDQMDTGDGVILEIPLHDLDVQATSDTVSSFGANIQVLISQLPVNGNEFNLNPVAADAWTGVGLYTERVVDQDRTGFFRVYPKAGYPKFWSYFRNSPLIDSKSSPMWIADCSVPPLTNESQDMSNIACKTRIQFTDVEAEISFSGKYVGNSNEIAEQVREKLMEWSR